MGPTQYIIAGLMLTIVIMGGASTLYYKSSQSTIAQLNKDVATEMANVQIARNQVEIANESVRKLESTRVKDQNRLLFLGDAVNKAMDELGELKKTFAKHDLNYLSIKKPGLIERIINRSTKGVLKDLEELTKPRDEG